MEDMEDEGNFLRRSVNDITSLLDINFGSLGRPSRGGRGRGAQGGLTSRPERAKPILERVGSHLSGEAKDGFILASQSGTIRNNRGHRE